MTIIVIIIAIVIIFYLISGGSSSNTRTSNSSPQIKISDYIPYEKNSDGNWCTQEMASEIIDIFSRNLGVGENGAKLYKSELKEILHSSKKKLTDEIKDNNKNIREHTTHYETQAKEFPEDIAELKDELKETNKGYKKVDTWLNRNIKKLETDCRKELRAILSAALRALKEDSENFHHLEINYNPPEMPDSLYYD